LFPRLTASGANLVETTFDDDATLSLGDGVAPYTGSFRSAHLLRLLNGLDMRGVWELRVADTVAGVSGTLLNWRIALNPCSPCADDWHAADWDRDNKISMSELLRVIQLYNMGGFHCAEDPASTDDGFVPGPGANMTCCPHDADYMEGPDWKISLSELLRVIQFYNSGGYHVCAEGEDGFCPGGV